MHRSLAPALVTLVALVAPASAGAYAIEEDRRADSRTVTYFNAAPEHDWAVEQSVRAWNESGADVEFVEAERGEAEMVIEAESQGLNGHARSTFHGDGEVRPGDSRVSLPILSKSAARESRFSVALIAVHELGHVLGLNHEDSGCAALNSSITNNAPARCEQPPDGEWRCRLLEEDDVKGVIELYGGRSQLSSEPHCPKTQSAPDELAPRAAKDPLTPPDVAEVSSVPGDSSRVTVRWLNGASDRIRSVAVARAEGRCPTEPEGGDEKVVDAKPESEGTATFPLQLESACYAIWSRDAKGRLSDEPAVAWLDGPESPKPPSGFVATPALSHALGDTGMSLRWQNPDQDTIRSVVIARAKDSCPTRPPRDSQPWSAPDAEPDAYQEFGDLGFYPGVDARRYCYAIWTRDRFGRVSRPATAWPGARARDEEIIVLAG